MSFVPLIRKDLALLARRRWWFGARGGMLLILLLVTLWQMYRVFREMRYGGPPIYIAREAYMTFVLVQVALMSLAAPAFGIGALEEARTSGTMDLLRLASISRMRLALVKLLAAGAWPGLLAISLIPFLALWALWAGISGEILLATIVLIALTGILLAALGLVARAMTHSSNVALGIGYALAAGWALGIPLIMLALDFKPEHIGWIHAPTAMILLAESSTGPYPWWTSAALAVVGTLTCGLVAGRALRWRDGGRARAVPETDTRAPRAQRPRISRTVWSRALLWKEVRTAGGRGRAWMTMGAWIVTGCLLLASAISGDREWRMVWFIIAFPILPSLLAAILAASSLTLEKEKGTLEPLLLAPQGPRKILLSKLSGLLVRSAPCIFLPLLYLPLLINNPVRPRELPYVFAIGGVVFLPAMFGTFTSVVFRRTTISVAVNFVGTFVQLFVYLWLADGPIDDLLHLSGDEELTAFVVLSVLAGIGWLVGAVALFTHRARTSGGT